MWDCYGATGKEYRKLLNLPIHEFLILLREGQKWKLQQNGLWEDPEIQKEKSEHLYKNRLTQEKLDIIYKARNG